jgi:DNA-binding MarR family transcriptional regulator
MSVVNTTTDEDLGVELRRAVARFYRRLRAERADDQLSDSQGSVLSLLVREGPKTASALSDFERVTPPSMNQIINALAARGFVERHRVESDRRQVLVAATREGTAVAKATLRRRHEWVHAQLDKLTADELENLAKAAAVMRRMADGE